MGAPLAGFRILCAHNINICASRMASLPNGRCTAIWSPSKSALNPVQANGCKRMALSQFVYEPSFIRIPAILGNASIDTDKEERNLALLKTLARQNRAMIRALAKNEFKYMVSEEFAAEYPEISNASKAREKVFFGSRKISRTNFGRFYVQHLKEISNILSQPLIALDSKKSVLYPLYFLREIEIRKALVKTLSDILKSRNLSIEDVVYKDLVGGLDEENYTPPKK